MSYIKDVVFFAVVGLLIYSLSWAQDFNAQRELDDRAAVKAWKAEHPDLKIWLLTCKVGWKIDCDQKIKNELPEVYNSYANK